MIHEEVPTNNTSGIVNPNNRLMGGTSKKDYRAENAKVQKIMAKWIKDRCLVQSI